MTVDNHTPGVGRADRSPPGRAPRTVADAMLNFPKTCPPTTTVDEARVMLLDDHVHALLVVDRGRLSAVVEPADLTSAPSDTAVGQSGKLVGRIVGPDVDVETTLRWMRAERRRRLAVVDHVGRLLGLLCLKRSGTGFCGDTDVFERARANDEAICRAGNPDSSATSQHRQQDAVVG
jgi:hypothetical protein